MFFQVVTVIKLSKKHDDNRLASFGIPTNVRFSSQVTEARIQQRCVAVRGVDAAFDLTWSFLPEVLCHTRWSLGLGINNPDAQLRDNYS